MNQAMQETAHEVIAALECMEGHVEHIKKACVGPIVRLKGDTDRTFEEVLDSIGIDVQEMRVALLQALKQPRIPGTEPPAPSHLVRGGRPEVQLKDMKALKKVCKRHGLDLQDFLGEYMVEVMKKRATRLGSKFEVISLERGKIRFRVSPK